MMLAGRVLGPSVHARDQEGRVWSAAVAMNHLHHDPRPAPTAASSVVIRQSSKSCPYLMQQNLLGAAHGE